MIMATRNEVRAIARRTHGADTNAITEAVVRGLPPYIARGGDCGVIMLAVLSGMNYDTAYDHATRYGYDDLYGMNTRGVFDMIKDYFDHGRVIRHYVGKTLRSYLKDRPEWSGIAIMENDHGAHVVAIIDGIAVNMTETQWDDQLVDTLKVTPHTSFYS